MDGLFLAFLALPFVFYAFVVQLRRMRLRSAASALDAEYADHGWFRAGAIVAKDFEVRIVRAGKTLRTQVHVNAPDTPGRFELAVILTNHSAVPYDAVVRAVPRVLDTRGALTSHPAVTAL